MLAGELFPNLDHDQLVLLAAVGGMLGVTVLACVALVVVHRMVVGMDDDRISHYFKRRGGRVRSSRRAYFGAGWMASRGQRIYEVRYVDSNGAGHEVTCKTSMLGGVFLTEDRILDEAKTPPPLASSHSRLQSLEEENRRLREELEKLKAQAISRSAT